MVCIRVVWILQLASSAHFFHFLRNPARYDLSLHPPSHLRKAPHSRYTVDVSSRPTHRSPPAIALLPLPLAYTYRTPCFGVCVQA